MLEKMRELRKSAGLTMKQLGETVGVAEGTISTYETGRSEPTLDVLCSIADVLDVSLDLLVRGKEKDHVETWSVQEMLKMFDTMSDESLELIQSVAVASLAEKRYKASLGQAEKA